jgi:hypothetical protein
MNEVLKLISERISAAPRNMQLFDWLFGDQKNNVLAGTPVVLFGTGGLAKELMVTLKFYGISPVCFATVKFQNPEAYIVDCLSFRPMSSRHHIKQV